MDEEFISRTGLLDPISTLSAFEAHRIEIGAAERNLPFFPGTIDIVIPLDFEGNAYDPITIRPTEKGVRREEFSLAWVSRGVNIRARPLADNMKYVFSDKVRSTAFRDIHVKILERMQKDDADVRRLRALVTFLTKHHASYSWDKVRASIRQFAKNAAVESATISFSVSEDGDSAVPIVVDESIKPYCSFLDYEEPMPKAVCVATGEVTDILEVHPLVRSTALQAAGAKDTGAVLVTFNKDNARSGRIPNSVEYLNGAYSAPVAIRAARALTFLTGFHNRANTIASPQGVCVFFDSSQSDAATRLRALIEGGNYPKDPGGREQQDLRTEHLASIRRFVRHPRVRPFVDDPEDFDVNWLVVNGQGGRLAIKHFEVTPFAKLNENAIDWLDDAAVEPLRAKHSRDLTINQMISALQGSWVGIQAVKPIGDKERAILRQQLYLAATLGRPLPTSLLPAALHAWKHTLPGFRGALRVKHGAKSVGLIRDGYLRMHHRVASIIKLCLARDPVNKCVKMTPELDHENKSPAYIAGRVFCAMVYAQEKALPDTATTIEANMAGAMRNPAATISRLYPKFTAHTRRLGQLAARYDALPASEKVDRETGETIPNFAGSALYKINKALDGSIASVPSNLPRVLDLHQQGEFVIGFHHQRADFYRKRLKPEASKTAPQGAEPSEQPQHSAAA